MVLNSTTSTLKIITAQASVVHVIIDYIDFSFNTTAPSLTAVNTQKTIITTATNTTILAAPAANVSRQILNVTIHNISTTQSNAVTINVDDNGTLYEEFDCTINSDEKLCFSKNKGWQRYSKSGIQINGESAGLPLKSHIFNVSKTGIGTSEAAGQFHFLGTGTGILGAWAIGTSGLSGRAVAKSEGGFLALPTPTNSLFLAENNLAANASLPISLVDVLFVNNGLVVTTTTAQTVNTVALPARDRNRTINGVDCLWGLLVTTATTNAAAIANITATYTDQDGNVGNTATMVNFPATATLGTFVPFTPANGDTGIRSIQSVTLGTSLTAGAVSLVCFRIVDTVTPPFANIPTLGSSNAKLIKLYGDEAITIMVMAVGATAYTINPSTILINEY